MGEIAEGLINGDFDFYTGEYIGKGYGYPRTGNRSLPHERKDFTSSKNIAFQGVRKYLFYRTGISEITPIIDGYIPGSDRSMKAKCLEIQKDWKAFINWVDSQPEVRR